MTAGGGGGGMTDGGGAATAAAVVKCGTPAVEYSCRNRVLIFSWLNSWYLYHSAQTAVSGNLTVLYVNRATVVYSSALAVV